MNVGDRVFVEGKGAGHIVAFQADHPWARDRRWWVVVELDTGRRVPVQPKDVKATK